MKTATLALLISSTQALTHVDKDMPCRQTKRTDKLEGEQVTPVADLPETFIWNNVNGTNFLTNIRNQHIPQYCGSCWAHAATSAMSDRIKIARKAAWPDINVAPQTLISCSGDDGCHGGEAYNAFEWMSKNEIADETCSIYRARGHDNGQKCDAITKCENCMPGQGCFAQDNYKVYQTEKFGTVKGEENMMQEIYQRGPIACGIAVTQALEDYKGGIFEDKTGDMDIVHDISVVGWGVENGTKYWTVRNSWGSHYGEDGFFRVVRGTNNIAIESDCAWATPKDTWTNDQRHKLTEEEKAEAPPKDFGMTVAYESMFMQKARCRVAKTYFEKGERPPKVHSWEELGENDVPENVDWRDVDGVNYLSWNKNQHIPVYCGSCWAQGTTSALADRFNIMLKDKSPTPVALDAQVIVNCQAGGSCNGGNPGGVYEFAYDEGIPDSSCEQYVAKNLDKDSCSAIDKCKDCKPPVCAEGDDSCLANCWAVEHKAYYAKNYYSVSGADKMKAELAKNGPIACGIEVTDKFEKYTGGIYSEFKIFPMINHEISVVGYGKTSDGEEYWIGRNSWGTYWGEGGFFRMATGRHGLGIESDCIAAIPSFDKPQAEEEVEFITA